MGKHYPLTPSCTPTVARKKWEHSTALLTKNDYKNLITQDAVGTLDGETKFVFLKGAFAPTATFYRALAQLKYGKSKRAAGTDALFGIFPNPRNELTFTNKTQQNWRFYEVELVPLLGWMSQTVRRRLPPYWKQQAAEKYRRIRAYDSRLAPLTGATYELHRLATSLFSTVSINRSAPLTPHMDRKNKGRLSCVMAFGEFTSGDLCFPRLRVAFRLRPGDLLIADTKHEYHGTVDGVSGDRISVAAYLR